MRRSSSLPKIIQSLNSWIYPVRLLNRTSVFNSDHVDFEEKICYRSRVRYEWRPPETVNLFSRNNWRRKRQKLRMNFFFLGNRFSGTKPLYNTNKILNFELREKSQQFHKKKPHYRNNFFFQVTSFNTHYLSTTFMVLLFFFLLK